METRAIPNYPSGWPGILFLLACFVATAGNLIGQSSLEAGSVEGQVLMLDNGPIPSDLTVRLAAAEGTYVNQAMVNTEGKFRFDNVQRGLYEIVVTAKGYRTATHSVDMSWLASRDARILMVPEVKKTVGASSSPTVTATDLSAPKTAQKEFEKGLGDLQNGNFEGAQKHLQKAITEHPCYARAHTMLGVTQSMRGQFDASVGAFNKAIECDPGFAEAYIQYANVLSSMNKNQECIQVAQRGLQRFPGEWLLHYHLGIALDGAGDYAKAEESLLKAQSLNAQVPPEFHLRIADVYLNAKKYEKAHEELAAYVQAEPRGRYAESSKMIMRKLETAGMVASARDKKDSKQKP